MRDHETMRELLVDYCRDAHCRHCPLQSPVSRCGCGAFFNTRITQRAYAAGGSYVVVSPEYDMTNDEIEDAFRIVLDAMEDGRVQRREEFFR